MTLPARATVVIVPALVMAVSLAGAAAAQSSMTTPERQRLIAHMQMTSSWLEDEVSGLAPAQLTFTRAAGEWTIAQVLDHLIVVAPIYWKDLQAAIKAGPDSRRSNMTDADVLWYGVDRTFREQAIPSEVPKGDVRSVADAMAEYRKHHGRLLQYIRTTKDDLRAHYVPRQSCDAYQWALLITAHEQRHILQIREIKADKRFPGR